MTVTVDVLFIYDAQRNVSRKTCGISWTVQDILVTSFLRNCNQINQLRVNA